MAESVTLKATTLRLVCSTTARELDRKSATLHGRLRWGRCDTSTGFMVYVDWEDGSSDVLVDAGVDRAEDALIEEFPKCGYVVPVRAVIRNVQVYLRELVEKRKLVKQVVQVANYRARASFTPYPLIIVGYHWEDEDGDS